MSLVVGIQIAVVFVWLGMVLGISFLETPLKFRAPGVTVPLAVSIGRLVFRALNIIEAAFAVALVVCLLLLPRVTTGALVIALCVVLVLGAAVLRPLIDRRVRGGTGDGHARGRLHIWYVLLECIKVGLLVLLGVTLLTSV